MYLSSITVKNFRCFGDEAQTIYFNSGLTLLVGENDSGKSAIIDAIKIVLGTTDQNWYRIESTDFHNEDTSKEITIICKFENLSSFEKAAFLECLTYEKSTVEAVGAQEPTQTERKPCLYLNWSCKYLKNFTPPRTSINTSTGISGDGQALDAEARELLRATYLRALRDAYHDMQSGRNSRLSQIVSSISDLNEGNEYTPDVDLSTLSITGIAKLSNKLLAEHPKLTKVNQDVSEILRDKMLLKSDTLSTRFAVSGSDLIEARTLVSLLEKLDLAINSNNGRTGLGTSNILSMACELLLNTTGKEGQSTFLLIEEPEAHLHAQRQLKLIQSLQEEAKKEPHQIILTTHSPLLASVVALENIVLLKNGSPYPMSRDMTKLANDDYLFLERFLDATKANLFFAKSVIMVEGPAEDLLLPTIAKLIGKNLTDYGVSIVNVMSTGLRRYARIFQRADDQKQLDIKVACITDRDIMPDCAPRICIDEKYADIAVWPEITRRKWRTESDYPTTANKETYFADIKSKADGQFVKTFVSDHWTIEYDLAYSGLIDEMISALVIVKYVEGNRTAKTQEITIKIDSLPSQEEKASYIYSFFYDNSTSKAEFAQQLASILEESYANKREEIIAKLPGYLVQAIHYVTGGGLGQ